MRNNWITIWDNTQEARLMYASESITDHLGWEPEEIIGREGYDLFHPGDRDSLRKVHLANVCNQKMSSMVSYRALTKNGTSIRVETILHYCHDVLIGSNYVYDENSLDHKVRASSADEVFVCLPDGSLQLAGAWNDRQEHMQNILNMDNTLNSNVASTQENRFCLILNRYSESLNIVYVSRLAAELVSLDTAAAIGTSLYQYVQQNYARSLEAQISLAKKHGMIVRLRFDWMMDREKGLSEPVEAIASSTGDGIVMALRLSPRFFVSE
ncbi:hypothetical protein [Parasitella parasitica]|uniref:PAS domain-containing protein n=1 Tax=Parasitella parasitica TaxID=35722 RepID=A0A0B7NPU8_9FUNG|nr:hypothetical protein [Parasitella parasitica]